jgi:hypothetical protein
MKVFVKVEALYEGTSKSATRPFVFDINTDSDKLTVADVKQAVRSQFKRIELSDSLVSERVEFAGKNDHADDVDIIAISGRCPNIKYTMFVTSNSEQTGVKRSIASGIKEGMQRPARTSKRYNDND